MRAVQCNCFTHYHYYQYRINYYAINESHQRRNSGLVCLYNVCFGHFSPGLLQTFKTQIKDSS